MCTLIVTVNNLRITNKINGKSRICILIIIVLLKISVRYENVITSDDDRIRIKIVNTCRKNFLILR